LSGIGLGTERTGVSVDVRHFEVIVSEKYVVATFGTAELESNVFVMAK
jgi:hypothetical protein